MLDINKVDRDVEIFIVDIYIATVKKLKNIEL